MSPGLSAWYSRVAAWGKAAFEMLPDYAAAAMDTADGAEVRLPGTRFDNTIRQIFQTHPPLQLQWRMGLEDLSYGVVKTCSRETHFRTIGGIHRCRRIVGQHLEGSLSPSGHP